MDVVVTGRHCQISDDFRAHVLERVAIVERLQDRLIRMHILVSMGGHGKDPDPGAGVEITLIGKGPVVRAEAHAHEKVAAFEQALDKLRTQLRKANDRRKVRRGRRSPVSVAEATARLVELPTGNLTDGDEPETHDVGGVRVTGDGPLVVRRKTHAAQPMSLEQALDQMELVGHDFYLFVDVESGQPSVVYRRRHYDYGVIHLDTSEAVIPIAASS